MKESIRPIVDSFILKNSGKEIFELYIDKVTEQEFDLTLFAGGESLTEKENIKYNQIPLVVLNMDGKSLNVYSGAERYIIPSDKPSIRKAVTNSDVGEYLLMRDSCDIITIDKTYPIVIYPFLIPTNTMSLEDVRIKK